MARCGWLLALGLLACRFDTSGLRPPPEHDLAALDLARGDRSDAPAPPPDVLGDLAPPHDLAPPPDLTHDTKSGHDLMAPDTKRAIGTTCSSGSQCASDHCEIKMGGGQICCDKSCDECDGCQSDGTGCFGC